MVRGARPRQRRRTPHEPARADVPIAAGQNEGHRYRHRELIANGAIDISQPNVVWGGGYTEGKKVAALAESYNLRIANGGGWSHHNAHLQAGVANGWHVEYHYLMWMVGEELYEDPYATDYGEVELPEKPGIGLEPNRDALAVHRVKRWRRRTPRRPVRAPAAAVPRLCRRS